MPSLVDSTTGGIYRLCRQISAGYVHVLGGTSAMMKTPFNIDEI